MNIWLALAAVNGAIAVLCGAFAAHGLKAMLPPDQLAVFETGARYQMYHALAMGLAALTPSRRPATLAAALFCIGIVLFSGSLYLLALTGARLLGFATPLGGICFVAGWGVLAYAALRRA